MKLTSTQRLMMVYLIQNSKEGKDGIKRTRANRSHIADFLGCTTRTVSSATRALEKAGCIKVLLSTNGFEKSIYIILKEEI